MKPRSRSHTSRGKLIRTGLLAFSGFIFVSFATFQLARGISSGKMLLMHKGPPDELVSWADHPLKFAVATCVYLFIELFFGSALLIWLAQLRAARRGLD
jgi:hypothetical protein